MAGELYLSIDVGTGSVRAALVDRDGHILFIESREHEQIVPAHGWSEQRADDWWQGVCTVVRRTVDRAGPDAGRIAALCACGQMHGTVLVDDDGRPTRPTVPLWNDKRTADHVAAFESNNRPEDYLTLTGNPPTTAWPAFKLQWLRDNDPKAYRRASAVLMPKDYINLRLTGERAMDWTEASCSFLADPATRDWSPRMVERLGLDAAKLAPIKAPDAVVGRVTAEAARQTGLREGTPVLAGAGDFPMALVGSGVCRPGWASDTTGTSCIITLIAEQPLLDREISNFLMPEGDWGSFVLLESGGDAMRWGRRAFHEGTLSYGEIVTKAAAAPAGSDGLFFLPYLVGERFGDHRNSRAQFFGLSAGHGLGHLHRAIMEGVAFAATRHLHTMQRASGVQLERVVASGGGAKTALWLEIKASAYERPILVPEEPECGVVGCAALAAYAMGSFPNLTAAVERFVRYADEIAPNPQWSERYARMQPIFDRLYGDAQAYYDDLDALTEQGPATRGTS